MTIEEKFKAIKERANTTKIDLDPSIISVMMIISYIDELQELNIIDAGMSTTPSGKEIVNICDEFDWKPTDEDIKNFVIETIELPDRPAFAYMLMQYRDDKEKFLEEVKSSNNI